MYVCIQIYLRVSFEALRWVGSGLKWMFGVKGKEPRLDNSIVFLSTLRVLYMCACMSVCACVHMYVCTYVHIYMYMCILFFLFIIFDQILHSLLLIGSVITIAMTTRLEGYRGIGVTSPFPFCWKFCYCVVVIQILVLRTIWVAYFILYAIKFLNHHYLNCDASHSRTLLSKAVWGSFSLEIISGGIHRDPPDPTSTMGFAIHQAVFELVSLGSLLRKVTKRLGRFLV